MYQRTGRPNLVSSPHQEADQNYPRRQNVFFMISSPTPGTFVIALHFKGRDKPIVEMDFKIDDLLEKVRCAFVISSQIS
jgi:hypothetical protein